MNGYIALKLNLEPPVVQQTVMFLQHLLSISEESGQPIVVFAHSQGAIIVEHALRSLTKEARRKLRIFTFGGGSMLPSEMCHPDSRNCANVKDLVCLLGSPNWQKIALERYYGKKNGKKDQEIIKELAIRDAFLESDSFSAFALEERVRVQIASYEKAFFKIRNLIILEPGNDKNSSHTFKNDCYQNEVKEIIGRYREEAQR